MNIKRLRQSFSPVASLPLVAAMSTIAASSSYAQERGAWVLEEVIITATKNDEVINDVGVTVNAFTGDQLKKMGVKTVQDIADHTPGLTVTETAAVGVPAYTIRGVGFLSPYTSASSTVGIYFDEVAIPYTVTSRGLMFDMERVEVLKGPQGDLFGRNTTAGQINFVSSKPTSTLEAGVTATYGRFDILDVEAFVSGSLTDTAQGRLALKTVQSDEGWQKSLTRDDELGEQDSIALRALLNWDVTDDFYALINVHYNKDESDNRANTAYDGTERFGQAQSLPTEGVIPFSTGDNRKADWTPGALKPQRDNELVGIAATLNWEFNDGDYLLTSITAYDDYDRAEVNDWDGAALLDSNSINTTELTTKSQEIRFSSTASDDLTWLAGLYYSEDKIDETYDYYMNDSFFSLVGIADGLLTAYTQESDSVGIFGHAEWQFTDDLKLVTGLRYTEESRTWEGCTNDKDGILAGFLNAVAGAVTFDGNGGLRPLQQGDCAVFNDDLASPAFGIYHPYKEKLETEKWMGKVGLDYALTEDILLYSTYSVGFKSGGFNGANAQTHSQLASYDDEQLTSIEIGAKMTLLDNTMQLNIAAFNYDYEDKQEPDSIITLVGPISGITNVPESRIYGAEFDMNWLPVDGLTINLGVAYLDTEIEKFDAVDAATSCSPALNATEPFCADFLAGGGLILTGTQDLSGIELAQSPEWQYNGEIVYEFDISSNLYVELGTDFSYTDDTTGGVLAEQATEDYWLVNARASLGGQDGDWRVTAWVRNLEDKYYYPSAYIGGNGPYVRSVGMPRTYGMTLDYSF